MKNNTNYQDMPVISSLDEFDTRTGGRIERLVFNHRTLLTTACLIITLVLSLFALRLPMKVSFEDMMPQSHEFIRNYMEHADSLKGLGNSVRIVVSNKEGDIYQPDYLETLREINDEVFLIPGVDRSFMKSLWMPVVRWTEITADGYQGGSVMPEGFDGSEQSVEALRRNIDRAGIVGSLVGNDHRLSTLFVPLGVRDTAARQALHYRASSDQHVLHSHDV